MNGASTGEIFNILLRVALGIAIIYGIMRFVRKTEEKKQKPEMTQEAKVAAKRVDTSASPLYYVIFDLENGERLELRVSEEIYALVAKEDMGRLTYRGQEFVRFERL